MLLAHEVVYLSCGSINSSSSHLCGHYVCSLHRSQLPHPISPYSLDLDWRMNLSSKLLRKSLLVSLVGIISPASQPCMPSWTFTILKNVIVVVFVLSVVDSYGTTLGSSGRRGILRGSLGNDGGKQRISINSKARSVA